MILRGLVLQREGQRDDQSQVVWEQMRGAANVDKEEKVQEMQGRKWAA